MGTYEGQLKSIETKLALLQFTDEETANIIEKAQLSSLERQRKIVEKKVDEVHNLKVDIQEAKLQRGEKKRRHQRMDRRNRRCIIEIRALYIGNGEDRKRNQAQTTRRREAG